MGFRATSLGGPDGGSTDNNGSPFNISGNYTVLDGDGYTDIYITTGLSTVTLTLPLAANNLNRKIRIMKADTGIGKLLVAIQGADVFDNGTSGGGTNSIPLFSRGDSVQMGVDTNNSYVPRWAVVSALSNWSTTQHTYSSPWVNVGDGTKIKRHGHMVEICVGADRGSLTIAQQVLSLPAEFRPNAAVFFACSTIPSLGGGGATCTMQPSGALEVGYIADTVNARGCCGSMQWAVL